MKFNVIDKSEFASGSNFARLDAEFVDPDFLRVEQALRARPGWRLHKLMTPVSNDLYKGPEDPEQIVRYVSIDSVDTEDGLAFPDDLRAADLPSRAKYHVRAGDILVSNVRPNRGGICLAGEELADSVASSGFTLVRLGQDPPISTEFLFAFLKTEYGKTQLVRRNRGSMYPAVVKDDVEGIWIPRPSAMLESEVVSSVGQALKHQKKFRATHSELMECLREYLSSYGAPPSPLEGPGEGIDWTEVSSLNVFGANGAQRLDADFFRKAYAEFDNHVQASGPSFLLGDYYELGPGRALGEGDEESPYIKQSVLTNVGVNWSALSYEEGTPGPRTARVCAGDILLACTAHEIYYVGRKVDFVRNVPAAIRDSNTCVPDLMIIRPRDTKPPHLCGSYVAGFLRHPAGLHQVQRCIRGLRGGHVYKDDLSRYVRIPLPSKGWLDGFEGLAEQMESARNEAKAMMLRAFRMVDDYITELIRR